MTTLDQLERSSVPASGLGTVVRPRGDSRRSVMSRRSYRSILSTRSHRSILSIRSEGSILSIGSAYSILSIGSVGSMLSVGSVGSFFSLGSAFSGLSRWSLLSWMGAREAPDPRPVLTVVPDEPDLSTDPTRHCQT